MQLDHVVVQPPTNKHEIQYELQLQESYSAKSLTQEQDNNGGAITIQPRRDASFDRYNGTNCYSFADVETINVACKHDIYPNKRNPQA